MDQNVVICFHNVTRIREVDRDIHLNYKKSYKLKDLGLMHVENS
jgi:hypothetical protein